MNSPTSNSPHCETTAWRKVAQFPEPVDYRKGLCIHKSLAPDNILIFPNVRQNASAFGQFHPRFVLNIICDCVEDLHVAGKEFELLSGESILIFPHQVHYGKITAPKKGKAAGVIVITFDLSDASAIESLRFTPRRLGQGEHELLDRLLIAYQQGLGLDTAYFLSLFLQALSRAPEISRERTSVPKDNPEGSAFLRTVQRYLRNSNMSPRELAAAFGVNERELQQQFRHYTGSSLSEYLRKMRMQQALKMLENQEGNITSISEELGFSSIHSFSRAFKMAHGLSPKQYEGLLRKNMAPAETTR